MAQRRRRGGTFALLIVLVAGSLGGGGGGGGGGGVAAVAAAAAGVAAGDLESLGDGPLSEWGRLRLRIGELRKTHTVKVLALVRHAEAENNAVERAVGHERWYGELSRLDTYFDPPLTATGAAQARRLSVDLGGAMAMSGGLGGLRPEVVLVSPLLRALQTAQLAFNATPDASLRARSSLVAVEDLRAVVGVQTCNRRRPTAKLATLFPGADFTSYLEPDIPLVSSTSTSTTISTATPTTTNLAASNAASGATMSTTMRAGAGNWGMGTQSSSSSSSSSSSNLGSSSFSFKDGPVELQDPLWHPDVRESDEELLARAGGFLRWAFWTRHESSLAVVSHHGLIAAMLRVLGVDDDGADGAGGADGGEQRGRMPPPPPPTTTTTMTTTMTMTMAAGVIGGGAFGLDFGNAQVTLVLLASKHALSDEAMAAAMAAAGAAGAAGAHPGWMVLGKAMLLLALLKLTMVVCCYGAWRKFSHLVLPRTNVSEGPTEESEELAGERLRYKGVLYVRVAQADTPLEDTGAPPLEDGETQHLHRHQPQPGEVELVEPTTAMTRSTATSPIPERVDV